MAPNPTVGVITGATIHNAYGQGTSVSKFDLEV